MICLAFHVRGSKRWEDKRLRKRATHPPDLHQVGYHDDAGRLLLPHHPPEVVHRLVHGTWAQLARSVTAEKFLGEFNGNDEEEIKIYSHLRRLTLSGNVVAGSLVALRIRHTKKNNNIRIRRTCRPRFTLSAGTSHLRLHWRKQAIHRWCRESLSHVWHLAALSPQQTRHIIQHTAGCKATWRATWSEIFHAAEAPSNSKHPRCTLTADYRECVNGHVRRET